MTSLQELDQQFPNDHTIEQQIVKLQKKITLKKPLLVKSSGNEINPKVLNQEILYNLEKKQCMKTNEKFSQELENIIQEVEFNKYEVAFSKLVDLIKAIEDSL